MSKESGEKKETNFKEEFANMIKSEETDTLEALLKVEGLFKEIRGGVDLPQDEIDEMFYEMVKNEIEKRKEEGKK